MRKPRIVIAGQLPPPWGGQNVMIARILEQVRAAPDLETAHLPFHFTADFKTVRRGSVAKVLELVRVIARLVTLRQRGPIDLLLFPAGGPQPVPIIRDLFLLPWVLLCAHRVVIQFHAAGIADRFAEKRGLLFALLSALYHRSFAAIVMTAFNRRDPELFGIPRIVAIPHRLPDEFSDSLVRRDPSRIRLLYVGHLCPDKGTPQLLRAFASLANRHPDLKLELVGETLPPFTDEHLHALIHELGLRDRVQLSGILTAQKKHEAFGRADLFVFPSIAPYESFGLVMIEAMMWGLPILATDWRGNRDVLGDKFDGKCFAIGADLTTSLTTALTNVLENFAKTSPSDTRNRRIFLERYCLREDSTDYPDAIRGWLPASRPSADGSR